MVKFVLTFIGSIMLMVLLFSIMIVAIAGGSSSDIPIMCFLLIVFFMILAVLFEIAIRIGRWIENMECEKNEANKNR